MMFGSEIIIIVVQILLFIFGLLIQIKIIYICWKDREGNTWQIHLTHSIVVTIYFAFIIVFSNLIKHIPNLSEHLEEWFCYLAAFVGLYGFYSVGLISFCIAFMKYRFILHNAKFLWLGKQGTKKAFLVLNLALPIILATISSATKDIDGHQRCLGLKDQGMKHGNTWENQIQKFFLCNLSAPAKDDSLQYVFYLMKQFACVLKSTVVMVINTNVLEAFFYYKIFNKMKR